MTNVYSHFHLVHACKYPHINAIMYDIVIIIQIKIPATKRFLIIIVRGCVNTQQGNCYKVDVKMYLNKVCANVSETNLGSDN